VRRALRQPWWTLPVIGLVASLPLVVRRVGDPDFFWHELTGQWMVQHHAFARSELYTYTVPGTPWTDHEYLTQLLFYGSAVVFPLSLNGKVENGVLEPIRIMRVIALNPVAQIIEDIRHALVTEDPRVPWTSTLLGARIAFPLAVTVTVAVVGLAVFQRLAPRFSESL